MSRNSKRPQLKPTTSESAAMSGLESALAKTARTAALRTLGRAIQVMGRSPVEHHLSQESYSTSAGNGINTLAETLSPEAVHDLEDLLASPEIASLTLNIITGILLVKCEGQSNRVSEALRQQLVQLMLLKTRLNEVEAGVATERLFAAMTSAVGNNVSELLGDSGSVPDLVKATLIKMRDSYFDAIVRNSELLTSITDLSDYEEFENQLRLQTRNLYGTMRLPHAGTSRRVPYEKLYVEPTVNFIDKPDSTGQLQLSQDTLSIPELAASTMRIVLLGDPGGGKSTLSLKLAYDTASDSGTAGTAAPFLVVLREYASDFARDRLSLIDYIDRVCRSPLGLAPPEGAIEYLLLNGRALVIFDGLDELLDTALRRQVVDSVIGFAFRYPSTPILVTSRRVGYVDAPLDPEIFTGVSLQEFAFPQVRQYVSNWFDLDESISPARQADLRESFISDSEFVEDLRVNPLMLSLMCGIYSSENYIPRNRPDVYEKCALLLFEKWDRQRGINSPLSFDAHVQAAMRSLALWLYPQQASQRGLPRDRLIDFMKNYLLEKRFDDEYEAENAATEFIDFCKGRAWVLTDIGSELYGFTHRTFLEYFAASQAVRLNPDPTRLFNYLSVRLEGGGWEVVAQLALQIINKTVEDGADDFLEVLLKRTETLDDVRLRTVLLTFATQALTYIVPRPPVLRSVAQGAISTFFSQSRATDISPHEDIDRADVGGPLDWLLGASSENLALVSKYTYDCLVKILQDRPDNQLALLLALYPDRYSRRSNLGASGYRGARDNSGFWREQVELNWELLATAIELQRTSYRWVETYLLEHGRATVNDFNSKFSVRGLYINDQRRAETSQILPYTQLVPRIWLAYARPPEEAVQMSEEHIDEMRRVLVQQRTPWFTEDEAQLSGIVSHVIGHISRRPVLLGSMASFLFFGATMIDLTGEDLADVPQRPVETLDPGVGEEEEEKKKAIRNPGVQELIRICRIRFESSSIDRDAERERLIRLGVDDATTEALVRWLSDRNFCFIRYKPGQRDVVRRVRR